MAIRRFGSFFSVPPLHPLIYFAHRKLRELHQASDKEIVEAALSALADEEKRDHGVVAARIAQLRATPPSEVEPLL